MLRIAVDIRHLATPLHTGVAQYTISLLHALIPLAPHIHFTLFSSGKLAAREHVPVFPYENCTHIHLQTSNRLLAFRSLFSPNFALEQLLPHEIDAWFFPNLNFIRTNKPYTLTIHDISFALFPHFFTLKQRLWHTLVHPKRLFTHASHLFAVSNNTKIDAVQLFDIPETKISVTHLGIPPAILVEQPNNNPERLAQLGITFPYFLTLSSFEPRKNLLRLILAYNHFRHTTQMKNPPHFVLAGGGGWKEKPLQKLIASSPYKNDIHLLRRFLESDKPLLYKNAVAFLFPSIYEGFGLPPLEALACGTPVIVSQTSSLPELFGEKAMLINPLAPHDFAFAMEQMFNQQIRERYQKSSDAIRQTFTFHKTAQKTLAILNTFSPTPNNS